MDFRAKLYLTSFQSHPWAGSCSGSNKWPVGMAEGKVPYTVGVAPLLEEARWWMSLIFTPEFSSFSHNRSCFCSHRLWPLQWFSMAGNRLWPWQHRGSRAVPALLLCCPSLRTAGAPWLRQQGHPGAGVQAHPTTLGWMHAWSIFLFPSPPNTFSGNYCIFSELKHRITHLPSEIPREPVKK